MFARKITAVFMAAVLVATLNPAAAIASPLQAGIAQQPGEQPVTQAKKSKKKTVYIVTKVKISDDDGYGNVSRTVEKYKYNGKKLAKRLTKTSKGTGEYSSDSTTKTKWHYNGSNLASREVIDPYSTTYTDFETTAKGKVKAVATTLPGTDFLEGMDNVTTMRYEYSGGKPASVSKERGVWQVVRLIDGTSMDRDCYDYIVDYASERFLYNKKGLMRAVKSTDYMGTKGKHRFSYDKMGNVKKASNDYKTYRCMNKYNKKGLLTKRVVKTDDSSRKVTCKFTWKKVKVKKSLVKKVKAQQWSIVNGDLNLAFGENPYDTGDNRYWW